MLRNIYETYARILVLQPSEQKELCKEVHYVLLMILTDLTRL